MNANDFKRYMEKQLKNLNQEFKKMKLRKQKYAMLKKINNTLQKKRALSPSSRRKN